MGMYRCLNCGKTFESAKPACAECEIDPEKDERDRDVIVELMTIHFDPPTKRAGRGRNHAACDPKLKVGAPRCQMTSEPSEVNCAACKASEAFKASGGFSNGALPLKAGPLKKGG